MAQSNTNNPSLHGMADLSNQLSQHSRNAVDTSLRASDVMSEVRIATDLASFCRFFFGFMMYVDLSVEGIFYYSILFSGKTASQLAKKKLLFLGSRGQGFNFRLTHSYTCTHLT